MLLGSARGSLPTGSPSIDKSIVLVSTSSEFQDDGKLVTTALEALATEDVQVVATLPSADVPASVPANARVEPFIPHAPDPRSAQPARSRTAARA